MDTLVFGDAPILRYFFARNRPIMKIDPLVARTRLELTREAFIDLCILCGTDFSETIHGVGPIRALALVRKHGCIENILQHLDPRHTPKEYFDYKLARKASFSSCLLSVYITSNLSYYRYSMIYRLCLIPFKR